MIYKFLIFLLITSPYLLHQVLANSTTAALEATPNSTSAAPKETSYFYQEPQGPGTYEFGYNVEDKPTENIQFRNETRFSNGTVNGSYGYLRADGLFTVISYVADQNGYRTRKKRINTNFTEPQTTVTATTTTEIPALNLTSGTLPSLLVDKVMDEFQIDLSPNASPGDILHPNISDIVNGKIPLTTDKNSSQLGFDVVQNFIPSNFPIVPFQLPADIPKKAFG